MCSLASMAPIIWTIHLHFLWIRRPIDMGEAGRGKSLIRLARLFVRATGQKDFLKSTGTMMKRNRQVVKRILIVLVILGIFASVVFLVHRQLRIDACLDGGGRWNYDDGTCERP